MVYRLIIKKRFSNIALDVLYIVGFIIINPHITPASVGVKERSHSGLVHYLGKVARC